MLLMLTNLGVIFNKYTGEVSQNNCIKMFYFVTLSKPGVKLANNSHTSFGKYISVSSRAITLHSWKGISLNCGGLRDCSAVNCEVVEKKKEISLSVNRKSNTSI